MIYVIWYLVGLFSSLFVFAYINKDIFGVWQIMLNELIISVLTGIGGLITLIIAIIFVLVIGINVDWNKIIWRKK